MLRLLPLSVFSLMVACSTETPPPATPTSPPPAKTTAAMATTPAPAMAPTPAMAPAPARTADLGAMSNDPETDRRMRTEVMKAIQPNRKQMRVCYNDALRKNSRLSGEITIQLTVAPSGEPVVIDDEGSTVKDKEFVDCVRSVLSKITTYPRWKGKAVTVVVPLEVLRGVDPGEG